MVTVYAISSLTRPYIYVGMSKGWKYFVPTDSHILGMTNFSYYKMQVENDNFKHNFN